MRSITFIYLKYLLYSMVEFGTGYNMPMDREYGHHGHAHDHAGSDRSPASNSTNDVNVGIKDLGMSLAVGPVPNVPAIGAKLRAGMKTLEIGFTGSGKGNAQQQTPEYYGEAQRRALQELGKANEVNFTTHASFGIQGLAGMDQQGNFSKSSKNFSIQEIRRAIEFAGDVAHGGPVVVHTGEFQRPIMGADWNQEGEFAGKFKMYEDEQERESHFVVDTRNGRLIQEARKNRKVSRPVWLQAEQDDSEQGVKKGDYVDYWGKKVSRSERVPIYNKEKGEFETQQYDWKDLQQEADKMSKEAQQDWERWRKASQEERKKIEEESQWGRFLKESISKKDIKVRPEEAYIIASLETSAGNARGWALNYSGDFQENIDHIKKLRKAKEFYKQIEDTSNPEEKERLKRQVGDLVPGLVPMDAKYPTDIIKRQLEHFENRIKQSREGAASQFAQAEEAMETIKHVQSAETYALEEAYDSYAQAGIAAMKQSEKMERKGILKKPITVAMENLFPESFGSHPDELIDLVLSSRKKMAERLQTEQRLSAEDAKRKAEQHITATLDTGHINIWRKYWKGDPNNTIEQNDKEFNTWIVKKTAEMAKNRVIGHVHLDDNYGYHDDHLAPGEGNTPITEMIKALKDNGYKGELIVEPGADWTTDLSGFHSVMKTWKLFGSPVYGAGQSMRGRGWSSIGSYMGMNQPPYFVFGSYSPSEDWTLWSGVPLE